jgi:acyl carrier protein
MEEIKQRVIQVLCTTLNVSADKISSVDKFADIEDWDSLNHLYILLGLEKEFGVKFEIQETANISAISNVSELIQRKLH